MEITYSQWHEDLRIRELTLQILRESQITELYLSGAEIGDFGLKQLLSSLEHNQVLETLYLDSNDLTYNEIASLRKFVLKHPSITFLNLDDNPLEYFGAIEVSWLLEESSSLSFLSLEYCDIDDRAMNHIIFSLQKNNYLDELNLSYNEFSQKNAENLIEALKHNTSLCALDFSSDELDESYIDEIGALLEKNLNHFELIPDKLFRRYQSQDPKIKFTKRENDLMSLPKEFELILLKTAFGSKNYSDFSEAISGNLGYLFEQVSAHKSEKPAFEQDVCGVIIDCLSTLVKNKNNRNVTPQTKIDSYYAQQFFRNNEPQNQI